MKWITKNEYYDLETGDQLKEKDAKDNYYVVRKTKKITTHKYTLNGKQNTIGHITYFNECRPTRQGRLYTTSDK